MILKPHPGSRKKRKRVGRGNASGHGNYSCRGVKGQRSRTGSSKRLGFEGGQTPLIRRMPKLRGFKNPKRIFCQIVSLFRLEKHFKEGDLVNKKNLFEKKLIGSLKKPVKILGGGNLTKKLTVEAEKFSKSAQAKIEKAKGKINVLTPAGKKRVP